MRSALLVIDMQEHFRLEDPAIFAEKLLPNVGSSLSIARSARTPVVHVVTRYRTDKSDWPAVRKDRETLWCLEGTAGAQILPAAEPHTGEPVVVKTRFSAFYNTDLDAVLANFAVASLVIVGYASDVCVRMTAIDAYNRGYRLSIVSDCVHPARETPEAALEYLRWLAGATVLTLSELEGQLRDQASPRNSGSTAK